MEKMTMQMKLERICVLLSIVSDELHEIEELGQEISGPLDTLWFHITVFFQTPEELNRTAEAALKESGIVRVEKLGKHDMFKICGEAPVLKQGAVLVMAKEKA